MVSLSNHGPPARNLVVRQAHHEVLGMRHNLSPPIGSYRRRPVSILMLRRDRCRCGAAWAPISYQARLSCSMRAASLARRSSCSRVRGNRQGVIWRFPPVMALGWHRLAGRRGGMARRPMRRHDKISFRQRYERKEDKRGFGTGISRDRRARRRDTPLPGHRAKSDVPGLQLLGPVAHWDAGAGSTPPISVRSRDRESNPGDPSRCKSPRSRFQCRPRDRSPVPIPRLRRQPC